ncbi:unnamed protein product [Pleuronectes platessa]|uniref:Uncharacterized protein n=1 Tax=Pleuronectes platessa TaxID=8262 RepID=A0A9N7VMC0_PLEPL|nr:unnamed protein product [Pleuronectes platessa]
MGGGLRCGSLRVQILAGNRRGKTERWREIEIWSWGDSEIAKDTCPMKEQLGGSGMLCKGCPAGLTANSGAEDPGSTPETKEHAYDQPLIFCLPAPHDMAATSGPQLGSLLSTA